MNYKQSVQKMIQARERRLIINLDDLRDYDREFCDGCVFICSLQSLSISVLNRAVSCRLLREPASWQPAADAALKDTAVNASNDRNAESLKKDTFYVGYKGSFGENHATPRTLKSDKLGKMVCLEGIVTRCKASTLSLTLSPSALEVQL